MSLSDEAKLARDRAEAEDKINQAQQCIVFAIDLISHGRRIHSADTEGRLSYLLDMTLQSASGFAEMARQLIEEVKSLGPGYVPF